MDQEKTLSSPVLNESGKETYQIIKSGEEQPSNTNGCLIAALIVVLMFIPFSLCGFIAASYYFLNSNLSDNNGFFDSNVNRPYDNEADDYIDPDKANNIEEILEDANENFNFTFKNGVNANSNLYEREFILANLQSEYEKLREKFGYDLSYKVTVKFTDDQDQYEKDFGRSYNYELSHAGFTTYGEIEFFVNPVGSYDRQDFKRLIAHELVHIYQFDNDSFVFSGTPTWFYEGTAEYLSDAPLYPLGTFDTAPDIDELGELEESFNSVESDPGLSAYLVANHFIHYLADEYGEEKILLMIKNSDYRNFDSLFIEVYGQNSDAIFTEWYESR